MRAQEAGQVSDGVDDLGIDAGGHAVYVVGHYGLRCCVCVHGPTLRYALARVKRIAGLTTGSPQ